MTGLSERVAREAGFDVGVAVVHMGHHASYYPGARELSLKVVYDRSTARLLGAQAFGYEGVEKRIDVLAMALHARLTIHDLTEVDLAYAPPYSSANDPINMVAFVAENDLGKFGPLITAAEAKAELASNTPPLVLDVRTDQEYRDGHLTGALHIPIDDLRRSINDVPRDRRIVVHCRSGVRAHLASRILRQHGHEDVANLTGGWVSMMLEGGFPVEDHAIS
jgi:rhodanese-related sulfurtransferase